MLADIIRQAFDMEVDTQHAWLTDVEYVYPISLSGIDIEEKLTLAIVIDSKNIGCIAR